MEKLVIKHSMNRKIEIKFVKDWPEEDIVNLYQAGGWWRDRYDPAGIKLLIKGSFAFVVAVDKDSGKAVGMGRAISDGVSDAYIQDLVVLPEHRDMGIGKKLTNALLDYCLSKKLLWVGLIAEPGQENFYSSLGFKPMKGHIPMRHQTEE